MDGSTSLACHISVKLKKKPNQRTLARRNWAPTKMTKKCHWKKGCGLLKSSRTSSIAWSTRIMFLYFLNTRSISGLQLRIQSVSYTTIIWTVEHTDPFTVFDLSSYLPDALIPQYEDLKDTIVSWLETLGIFQGSDERSTGLCPLDYVNFCFVLTLSSDSSRARQALADAEASLNRVKEQKADAESDLAEVFNIHGFGAEGEWKKLDGTCLEKDTGEYVWCLLLCDRS